MVYYRPRILAWNEKRAKERKSRASAATPVPASSDVIPSQTDAKVKEEKDNCNIEDEDQGENVDVSSAVEQHQQECEDTICQSLS